MTGVHVQQRHKQHRSHARLRILGTSAGSNETLTRWPFSAEASLSIRFLCGVGSCLGISSTANYHGHRDCCHERQLSQKEKSDPLSSMY